jgi:hypothetical protein
LFGCLKLTRPWRERERVGCVARSAGAVRRRAAGGARRREATFTLHPPARGRPQAQLTLLYACDELATTRTTNTTLTGLSPNPVQKGRSGARGTLNLSSAPKSSARALTLSLPRCRSHFRALALTFELAAASAAPRTPASTHSEHRPSLGGGRPRRRRARRQRCHRCARSSRALAPPSSCPGRGQVAAGPRPPAWWPGGKRAAMAPSSGGA